MNIQTKHNPQTNIVRVFVDEKNHFGSPLGIVVDEKMQIDGKHRQQIATTLNYSETVFINDIQSGSITVFSPQQECPFSMYAAMGAAWFINTKLKCQISQLVSKDQTIAVFLKEGTMWVRSKLSILPPWNFVEYQTVSEIESFKESEFLQKEHVMAWAWADKQKEIIRARTFANDWGIPEDEANGSGAMRLAAKLKKNVTVIHGKGSIICAKSIDQNHGEVGGRCYSL